MEATPDKIVGMMHGTPPAGHNIQAVQTPLAESWVLPQETRKLDE